MSIPNDVVEFVILGYNPVAFLSTSRRLNAAARDAIMPLIDPVRRIYIHRFIEHDPVIIAHEWNWRVYRKIRAAINDFAILQMIYQYDAVNCLRTLINQYVDVSVYTYEAVFSNRSFECLRELVGYIGGKFVMFAQVHAMRFDDAEMLDIVYEAANIKPTSKKLYGALIGRHMNCYRYLLGHTTPSLEIYEYLVSQDLSQLLDETLSHSASWEFKNYQLNDYDFHRFAGESANMATLRVLLKHGFNPVLHDKVAITAASASNMGVAITLSKYIDSTTTITNKV